MNQHDYGNWPIREYAAKVYFPELASTWTRPDVFRTTHRRSLKALEEMVGRELRMNEVTRPMIDEFQVWLRTSRHKRVTNLYTYVARIVRHWQPDRLNMRIELPKPTWRDYVSSWWKGDDPEGLLAGCDRYLREKFLAPGHAAMIKLHTERFVEWTKLQAAEVRNQPIEKRLDYWTGELSPLLAPTTVHNHRKSVKAIAMYLHHQHAREAQHVR